MSNPDLPPDSITTLPVEQRTAAIRERYNDMAYSGPTAQDRERDTVIGWLLDRLETAERHMLERDDENTLLTEELAEARQLYETYCAPPDVKELLRQRNEMRTQVDAAGERVDDLWTELVGLRAQFKERSEWGQRAWNAWRSARDRAQRARTAFPVFQTPAGPVHVRYWPAAATPEQVEAAKQAVLETVHELLAEQQAPTVEVTTSEPNAALYFTCQNRHPLAARTTTVLENGERRAVHHEVVCPACEADGITEVRLPDLDDEADDD